MNYRGTEAGSRALQDATGSRAAPEVRRPLWIIGYGNPQRRDDGIGPFVIRRLAESLEGKQGIRTLALQQLEPELIEELEGVDTLILVDASVRGSGAGVEWKEVEPDLRAAHYLTHQVTPAHFLGLMAAVHRRRPRAWVVCIQGDDFEFGEGLSPQAEARSHRAIEEILCFVQCGKRGPRHSTMEEKPPSKGDGEEVSLALGG